MLLGEPPRSQGDLHFSLFGVPVRVHPFFWLVGVLLANPFQAVDLRAMLASVLPWLAALFLSILIHELGHAAAMRFYGFSPWITLYGFGGLTSYNPGQRYKSRGLGTLGQVLISAAGPGAGFLLAAVVIGVVLAAGGGVVVETIAGFLPRAYIVGPVGSVHVATFLDAILFISIFWGIINLLPVYPLDGGQITREVCLKVSPRNGIRWSLMLSVVAATMMAVFAVTQFRSVLMAVFFGYFAYTSYTTLQSYSRP